METLGWVFLLAGGLLLRQVFTGRAGNLREDASSAFTAFVNGDFGSLSKVSAQRGTNVETVNPEPVTMDGASSPVPVTASSSAFLDKARELAKKANYRYGWGKSGPAEYDCSGLCYRSLVDLGLYRGPRFTTQTFPLFAAKEFDPVQGPQVGDVVLWGKAVGGHMGIVSGSDKCFSARSEASGIGEATISGFTKEKGVQPQYFRLVSNG